MNKPIKTLLFNPFEKIAGMKAFALGIVIVAATVIIGHFSNTLFPGVASVKISVRSLGTAFLVQGIGLATIIVTMYAAASILSRNIRFSDFLGTITLSRYPFIFAALPGFFVNAVSTDDVRRNIIEDTFRISDVSGMLIAGVIIMVFAVWSMMLLYNAYRISSGLKGPKLGWSYAACVIATEIITGVAMYNMYA